ncbi:MAG: reprolysin-like metallopeptidase [Bacteroidia bacterium]
MKRFLFTLLAMTCALPSIQAQQSANLWRDVSEVKYSHLQNDRVIIPSEYRLVSLDLNALQAIQQTTPMEAIVGYGLVAKSSQTIELPFPDGSNHLFKLVESPILGAKAASQFPMIHTYLGECMDMKGVTTRITVGPMGLDAIVLGAEEGVFYVTPYVRNNATSDAHISYYRNNDRQYEYACGTEDKIEEEILAGDYSQAKVLAGDCSLRTYRMAISLTGEYTVWSGNSKALALNNLTATVNNISAVYEKTIAVRFTLVTDSSIIYTNAATDPFTTVTFPSSSTLTQNQNSLDNTIGNGKYEIGEVYNKGWNGGLAILSGLCSSTNKGKAACGMDFGQGPFGSSFEVITMHETAHLFNVTHTHNSTSGQCGSGNFSAGTSYEAGGGITIMAYNTVCTGNSYGSAQHFFHIGSIAQMSQKILSTSCQNILTNITNNAPVADVATNAYLIPKSTPFYLTMTASDADGDALKYNWEQIDANSGSTLSPQTTNATGPMFRSFAPVNTPTRSLPNLVSYAGGSATPYEVLPSVARQMKFRGTARDDKAGGGCSDEVNITVSTSATAGPFTVTSQNALGITYTANGANTTDVTWNVAGTNVSPISCPNVKILLSLNGGLSYPVVVTASTPNDGSETIIIPNQATTKGRFRVECENNIFFNINTKNFTIVATATGIEAPELTSIANVYPNPAQNELNVEIDSEKTEEMTLSVYDLSGRLIAQKNIQAQAGKQTQVINTSTFAAGAYILKVETSEVSYPHRFFIDR